jgi:hypothetical protein
MTDGDVSPGRSSVVARESEGKEVSGVSTSDWEVSEEVAWVGGLDEAIDPVGVRGGGKDWGVTRPGEMRGRRVFEDDGISWGRRGEGGGTKPKLRPAPVLDVAR